VPDSEGVLRVKFSGIRAHRKELEYGAGRGGAGRGRGGGAGAQAMRYGAGEFLCQWRDFGVAFAAWNDIFTAGLAARPRDGYRGVVCALPARTASRVQFRFAMGSTPDPAMVVWHVVPTLLSRLGARTMSYLDDTVIPGDGSLRLYGISPAMGPEGGGTKITVRAPPPPRAARLGSRLGARRAPGRIRLGALRVRPSLRSESPPVQVYGQHFSLYCNTSAAAHCNRFICRFRFYPAGRVVDSSLRAEFVSDQLLTCVSPAAAPQCGYAVVEVAVDGCGPCNSRMKDRFTPSAYNFFYFRYQTRGTTTEVPASCCDPDPRAVPHRLQGEWLSCAPNRTGAGEPGPCAGWPSIDPGVDEQGWMSCLGGFAPEGVNASGANSSVPGVDTTGAAYPVWCMRAFPANAGNSYALLLMDPFQHVAVFGYRPVPANYPGFCQRTTHHIPWEPLRAQLDYRLYDYLDPLHSTDVARRRGAPADPGRVTQGRNLVDRLWSTPALDQTVPYMRDVLHSIGERCVVGPALRAPAGERVGRVQPMRGCLHG
jgi:hypothetical protein